MVLNISWIKDIKVVHSLHNKNFLIDEQICCHYQQHCWKRENQPGDSILFSTNTLSTFQDWAFGPFLNTQGHTNVAVAFQYSQFIQECLNTCQIKPYHTYFSSYWDQVYEWTTLMGPICDMDWNSYKQSDINKNKVNWVVLNPFIGCRLNAYIITSSLHSVLELDTSHGVG